MQQKKKTSLKKSIQKKNDLPKAPSGISGLDEITEGGFPKGRPVLVCGSAGCGKTLMAAQFIVKGITDYNERGVFMTFEESVDDLSQNVKSLGFDLKKLTAENKLRVDFVRIERNEITETGEFDLEGLFIRLNHAIDSIGAKRVVLDTIESIFAGVENLSILRAEIRRLFHWLKEKGVTTIITGERGEKLLTRQGLEEYVSDCVILLDFRVIEQIATRRLRIIKYRGSIHGTNEYPFIIDENGFSVIPITSLKLDYPASHKIISTGFQELDKLFGHGGVYQGGSILVTGTAGTAKTTIASYFALDACRRKEKVLFFSFEESPEQIIRNMAEIGINLKPHVRSGLLHLKSTRPTLQGLEMHLLLIQKMVQELKPGTVIIDPISSFAIAGTVLEVRAMLVRILDLLKTHNINAMLTSLTHGNNNQFSDATVDAISSLSDTWVDLKNERMDKEITRSLRIIKSRGTGHAGDLQEFIITGKGIKFKANKKN